MTTAICILNWNGQKLLERFLPSVLAHSPKASIYIIDNGSTDQSCSWVATTYPDVHIIELDQNYGYAGGYNLGLQQIEADVYCLLNSDIRVEAGWLAPIQESFAENSKMGLAQPRIKQIENSEFFEYAGAAGGFLDALGYPYCRGRILNHLERDHGQYSDSRPVQWASGACLFVRKSCWEELQGFDADFFAHQEEIDLCWRARNKGWEVWTIGNSEVFHLGGATLPQSPQKWYLNFRNSLWMLQKNLPAHKLYSVLWQRMVLDGLAAVVFLCRLQFGNFFAVLKAHRDLYIYWSKNQKKRNAQDTHREDYFHSKSIFWNFFVLKRSKFSDIPLDKRE